MQYHTLSALQLSFSYTLPQNEAKYAQADVNAEVEEAR